MTDNLETAQKIVDQYPVDEGFDAKTLLIEEVAEALTAVRDAEREKVAKAMIELGIATGHGDRIEDLLKEWAAEYTRAKDLTKGIEL